MAAVFYKSLFSNSKMAAMFYKSLFSNSKMAAMFYKSLFSNSKMAAMFYKSLFSNSKMAAMFYKSLFSTAKWRRCFMSLCSPQQNGGNVVFFSRRSKMAEEHVYFPSVCGGRGPVLQTQLSCGH